MNVDACLRDGFSTAGTAGTGLGAIRRLAHQFEAYSTPAGTIVSAGFGPGDEHLGVARAPMHGESACGDSWSVVRRNGETWVLVADGLGHGEFAAAAAAQAVVTFEASRFDTVASVVQDIHLALRPTRGAAIAVARCRRNFYRVLRTWKHFRRDLFGRIIHKYGIDGRNCRRWKRGRSIRSLTDTVRALC